MGWPSDKKERLLSNVAYGSAGDSSARLQRQTNRAIANYSAELKQQEARDTVRLMVETPLGHGGFGNVFKLVGEDRAVKLEGVSDQEAFYESAALSIVMGESLIGPVCYKDGTYIARQVILQHPNGSQSTFQPKKNATRTGVLSMEVFTSDLEAYFKKHSHQVFFREKAKIEAFLTVCIEGMVTAGILCSDIKPKNALVRCDSTGIIEKVVLSDFDTRYCCRNEESDTDSRFPKFKVCSPPFTERMRDIAILAIKLLMCWTTQVYGSMEGTRSPPVIFAEESLQFFRKCVETPEILKSMDNMFDQFRHYVNHVDIQYDFDDAYRIFSEEVLAQKKYQDKTLLLRSIVEAWKRPEHDARISELVSEFVSKLQELHASREREATLEETTTKERLKESLSKWLRRDRESPLERLDGRSRSS